MIEDQNLWWISKDNVLKNNYYKKYFESQIKWDPNIINNLSLEPFSLNFIFGPRQVGKSTSLILLVKNLIDKGINPKSIFYFACDQLADYKELDEVLNKYLFIKEREGIKNSFIILDEVTYPREWFRTIKFRIDKGDFKNDVLILSGSLSMKAKKETETFPGRRGKGKMLLMLPLPFSKYVKIFGIDIQQGNLNFVLENYHKYTAYLPILSKLFDNYLITGGYPNSINSFIKNGKIELSIIQDLISPIINDLAKLRKSERFFKLTIKAILEKSSSEFSFQSISKEFGVGTVKTAISYVDLMQYLFLLYVVEAIDPNSLSVIPRKEKKFYFIDPLLYDAFSKWTLTRIPDESKIAEAVVISHLARIHNVNYYKSNHEVDLTVRNGNELIGFEIKFGKAVKKRKIVGKMKKLYVLSRNQIEENVIPIPLFLGMLEIPQIIEMTI